MDAVYTPFQARIDALVYPENGGPELLAYNAVVREIDAEFRDALAAEYLGDIAESQVQPIADAIWTRAEAEGHASGRYDIEDQYSELAAIANLAYRAATN